MKFVKEIIPYIIIIVVVTMVRTFLVTPVWVDGVSMNPTLDDRDILILNKYDTKYERFEIVVLNFMDEKLIKRVIGLPGDTIHYKDNKLYINGEIVEENFLHKDTPNFSLKDIGYEVVPENYYFVVGDNRTDSLDSRTFGFVKKDDIDGTVKVSLWPFGKVN